VTKQHDIQRKTMKRGRQVASVCALLMWQHWCAAHRHGHINIGLTSLVCLKRAAMLEESGGFQVMVMDGADFSFTGNWCFLERLPSSRVFLQAMQCEQLAEKTLRQPLTGSTTAGHVQCKAHARRSRQCTQSYIMQSEQSAQQSREQ
jgi:hypothetical protein